MGRDLANPRPNRERTPVRHLRYVLPVLVALVIPTSLVAQVALVERNVNLRFDPSTAHEPLRKLVPPEIVALLDTVKVSGYLRVRTADGLEGWVWSRNVEVDLDQGFVTNPPDVFTPYDRSDWDHWVDADGDCQDARQEVLIRDSSEPVTFQVGGDCRVETGVWLDPFGGETFTNPSDIDIDHMVPLRNAHFAGGWRWDVDKKRAYANDLTDPHHLLAVKDNLNQSKGAKGPEDWMPPDTTYWCTYVADWKRIKDRWELTLTPPEKAKVDSLFSACSP